MTDVIDHIRQASSFRQLGEEIRRVEFSNLEAQEIAVAAHKLAEVSHPAPSVSHCAARHAYIRAAAELPQGAGRCLAEDDRVLERALWPVHAAGQSARPGTEGIESGHRTLERADAVDRAAGRRGFRRFLGDGRRARAPAHPRSCPVLGGPGGRSHDRKPAGDQFSATPVSHVWSRRCQAESFRAKLLRKTQHGALRLDAVPQPLRRPRPGVRRCGSWRRNFLDAPGLLSCQAAMAAWTVHGDRPRLVAPRDRGQGLGAQVPRARPRQHPVGRRGRRRWAAGHQDRPRRPAKGRLMPTFKG